MAKKTGPNGLDSLEKDHEGNPSTDQSKLKKPQREPTLADYLRIFTYAKKWDILVYVIASIASVGAGVTLPLMNIVFGQLVSQFSDYFRDTSNISVDVFEKLLQKQALYILALFLGRWILNAVNVFCFRMIGIRLSSAVRLHYLQSLLRQPIHVIDTMPTGAPAIAITTTSNTLQLGISERLGTFLQFNGTIWGAIVVAFISNWQLTLVTSSVILYLLIVLAVCLPLLLKSHTAATKADAEGIAIASESLGAIKLITAFGAYSKVLDRHQKKVQEAMRYAKKGAPVMGAELGLIFFGIYGAFGLAFWYGAQRYVVGNLEGPGVVVVVLMSVMMILTSLERVATPLLAVSNAMVAACSLFTVIDAKVPELGHSETGLDASDLVFENVTFAYPGRPTVKVLDNLGICIKPGISTALVGPSGSGKSTIVGLIAQWYSLRESYALAQVKMPAKKGTMSAPETTEEDIDEPEDQDLSNAVSLSGSIKVGDRNLEDLNPVWWRRQVAIVQQEPFLFNDTIFGNVANGLIGTAWENETMERKRELVEEACREAYAHEFIRRLPDSYDTRVGDGGAKLSGGQKQRIAIARSIIKKPKVIILDEATSALDTKSEKVVQAALDKISVGRTTITIAHRLSTIKRADQIIVLDKGRAVEQGTHQSLMDSSGVYASLVRAQHLSTSTNDESLQGDEFLQAVREEVEDMSIHKSFDTKIGDKAEDAKDPENVPRGLARSFGVLLYRQRKQWSSYAAIIASSMGVAAGTPLQAWLFSKVISVFLLSEDEMRNKSRFWALMWLSLAAGVGLAYFSTGLISLRVQNYVSAAYKESYFTDMLHQRLAFFDNDGNSHGALTSRISSDVKQLEELMGVNMAFFFVGIFTVIGCAIISLIFAWKLALVATFVTMPIMLAAGYRKFRYEIEFNDMNAAVFKESSQFATEAIGAIRTVSALTMEGAIIQKYRQLLNGHVKAAYVKARWTALIFGFADSASLGCQALVFWYGGKLLVKGEYTMEAFFVCFMAVINGAEAASQALSIAPNAAQATSSANRILDLQQTTTYAAFEESERADVNTHEQSALQLEFRDVSFRYPTRDVSVFNSLNLTFEKGKYIALVGPSGCGKSTIISLLERFYDVEAGQGEIFCNGTNINDINMHIYRRDIALVPQEPTLFKGSVRDNIVFGIDDPSSITDERIHEVCRDAFIHDFIVSLPEGYNTNVGQKGVSMSGGQKQRIAIARALLRNPKMLLLDEATSALDSESERVVQAAIEKARHGRTMIAVAHRLSTIQDADLIVVLEDGRVMEQGTHSELLRRHGVYWQMCESQSLSR